MLETCTSHPNHSHREVGFVVTAKKRIMVTGLGSYFYIGRAPPTATLHLFHRAGRHQFGHVPHLTELQVTRAIFHLRNRFLECLRVLRGKGGREGGGGEG